MTVGGTVIENRLIRNGELRVLWCIDRRHPHDECAVFADPKEAANVQPGDWIWWQSGWVYWTRHRPGTFDNPEFTERKLRKIGGSFDPRRVSDAEIER